MGNPSRALVVDDDDDLRAAVATVLELSGMSVETAVSAEDALPRIAPLSHDLVLSDLRMPGGGGLRLLNEAKRIDPSLPFVLMTGFGDVESSVEALRLSADDYLTKPMSAAELRRVCGRALEKGKLLRENQRQRDRLQRLYETQAKFLAAMSHELRTPLTTIIGMSELLADCTFGDLNPKQRSYVAALSDSARHLHGLINDVLDYCKVEAGEMSLDLGLFHGAEVVANAVAVAEGNALRKGIAVRLDLGAEARSARLFGDRGKVVQILVNLLSNAIKFSASGSDVTVRCEVVAGVVRFAVSDHGVGIPPGSLEEVFQAFRQVHGGASGKDPGTGLGLAVSRELARLHAGDVRVESELGVGSTFTLELPRAPEALAGDVSSACAAPSLVGAARE